jgi:hypothetical protein
MAENISEITVATEDEGEVLVEELDKVVLTKGPWSTILFRYRERNPKTQEFGPPKATIKRYQKLKGSYRKRDSINLNLDSAQHLVSVLQDWIHNGQLGPIVNEEDLPY